MLSKLVGWLSAWWLDELVPALGLACYGESHNSHEAFRSLHKYYS